MRTLVVVNGEKDWPCYLPGCTLHHGRLHTSRWLYDDVQLWVSDATGSVRIETVLWRVGAIRPHPSRRTVLELIRRVRVRCVNPAAVLLQFYEHVFGWHRIMEQPGERAFLGDGTGGQLEILVADGPPLGAPSPGLHGGARRVRRRAGGAAPGGRTALQQPRSNPFGDRLVFFTDPAGNLA